MGPDNNMWFVSTGNKIGKISPSTGEITKYIVPGYGGNTLPKLLDVIHSITVGPNGNLWFTEFNGNKIGKISPVTGNINEYGLSSGRSMPNVIVAGPDGNMWFTAYYGNAISNISPTGVITDYHIPTSDILGTLPVSICVGPDGYLWFTEYEGNKIGKISPITGSISQYNVPSSQAGISDVTSCSDGNLWFTENKGNKIGKISPTTSDITEYEIPTVGSGVLGITTGPDGNLWFTELQGDKIGKISPMTGDITEYPIEN
jgi:virginiamycin B lyase